MILRNLRNQSLSLLIFRLALVCLSTCFHLISFPKHSDPTVLFQQVTKTQLFVICQQLVETQFAMLLQLVVKSQFALLFKLVVKSRIALLFKLVV